MNGNEGGKMENNIQSGDTGHQMQRNRKTVSDLQSMTAMNDRLHLKKWV